MITGRTLTIYKNNPTLLPIMFLFIGTLSGGCAINPPPKEAFDFARNVEMEVGQSIREAMQVVGSMSALATVLESKPTLMDDDIEHLKRLRTCIGSVSDAIRGFRLVQEVRVTQHRFPNTGQSDIELLEKTSSAVRRQAPKVVTAAKRLAQSPHDEKRHRRLTGTHQILLIHIETLDFSRSVAIGGYRPGYLLNPQKDMSIPKKK